MKKVSFFAVLLAALIAVTVMCFTACDTTTPSSNTITSESDVEPTEVFDFDEQSLVAAYCSGEWDGSFLTDGTHCASIKNGKLWIDCSKAYTYTVPDMGPYERSVWTKVLKSDYSGTWTFDEETGIIEKWSRGIRHLKIVTNFESHYYTQIAVLENCIVARYGSQAVVYSLEGYIVENITDILDYYPHDGVVDIATFSHENVRISPDGELEILFSSYVRYPRGQKTVNSSEVEVVEVVEEVSNLYLNTDWNGDCQLYEGNFVSVDYFTGNIIVNNDIVGNVSVASGAEKGLNLVFSTDSAYYLDGHDFITFAGGEIMNRVNIPDGNAEFLWIRDSKTAVIKIYTNSEENEVAIIVVNDGDLRIISTKALDGFVAYDTLYYMEGDTVFSLAWENPEATPQVFYEGAYGLSHFSDEGEGCVVPIEEANWSSYGYNNIYSPYGIQ